MFRELCSEYRTEKHYFPRIFIPRAGIYICIIFAIILLLSLSNDTIFSNDSQMHLQFRGRPSCIPNAVNGLGNRLTSKNSKQWIVVTSINHPTDDIKRLASQPGWTLVVVADSKTPADWSVPGVHFLSVQQQMNLSLTLPSLLPFKTYTRKNVGYLYAIMNGAEWIYDTDDDNKPYALGLDQFDYSPTVSGLRYRANHPQSNISERLFNPYRFYGNTDMWPRGFPLEYISDHTNGRDRLLLCHETPTPAVQQGMVHKDPDVDAIYRLLKADRKTGLTKRFNRFAPTITLESGTYAPWNSQNTLFNRKAFFTMMLPTTVEFRVTDIWRSFFAQKLLHLIGEEVAFYPANAVQFRNAHDYLADFEDERAVYIKSGKIIEFIHAWQCNETETSKCAVKLATEFRDHGFMGDADVSLFNVWIQDLKKIGYKFPPLVKSARSYKDDSLVTAMGNCRAAGLELVTDMTEQPIEPQVERAQQKMDNFGELLEWCCPDNNNEKVARKSFFSAKQLAAKHSKMESLTNRHESVLVITYNWPMTDSIGVLQRLYEPFFALTVFCGTWNPNNYNYAESAPEMKFPFNYINVTAEEMHEGFFAYYCISKINDMRLQNIKGYYFMADDSVFNMWNWNAVDRVVLAGSKNKDKITGWWTGPTGNASALRSADLFEQKYANSSKHQSLWKEAQNRLNAGGVNETIRSYLTRFTGLAMGDFFYVPQYEMAFFSGLAEVFREGTLFHEIVVGKLMSLTTCRIDDLPNYSYLWGYKREIWDEQYSPDWIMMHPLKLSHLSKKTEKTKFCNVLVRTFEERLYT